MKLTHKLGKLLRVETLESARDHLLRLTNPLPRERFLEELDPSQWRELKCSPICTSSTGQAAKFADFIYWIDVNIERAQDLGLNYSSPLRILDLGCGPGYFLHVCRCLGHHAIGIDLGEKSLFREITSLLNVSWRAHRISPYQPLPDLGTRFHLITAFCLCFDKIRRIEGRDWQRWEVPEWRYFVHDMRERLLGPGGRMVLDFNPRANGSYYSTAVKDLFLCEGATLWRSRVSFKQQNWKSRVKRHYAAAAPPSLCEPVAVSALSA